MKQFQSNILKQYLCLALRAAHVSLQNVGLFSFQGPDYYSDDEHGLVMYHHPRSTSDEHSIKSRAGNSTMTVINKDNNSSNSCTSSVTSRTKKRDETYSPERKGSASI